MSTQLRNLTCLQLATLLPAGGRKGLTAGKLPLTVLTAMLQNATTSLPDISHVYRVPHSCLQRNLGWLQSATDPQDFVMMQIVARTLTGIWLAAECCRHPRRMA